MADTLFDVEATPAPAKLSPDQRRTVRQAEALVYGQHPIALALDSSIHLHVDAAPASDREAPGRRCGNCWYREHFRYHNRTYAKCTVDDGVRITHGAGTDVRAWWPACRDHTYGDPSLSADAARCVPACTEVGLPTQAMRDEHAAYRRSHGDGAATGTPNQGAGGGS